MALPRKVAACALAFVLCCSFTVAALAPSCAYGEEGQDPDPVAVDAAEGSSTALGTGSAATNPNETVGQGDSETVVTKPKPAGTWKKTSGKWWYQNANGSYPRSSWKEIDGKWYHFDARGYMQTGWLKIGGKWYYLNASGDMATGWKTVSGKRYYLNSSGAMKTGWQKISNTWCYFASSGAMKTGWLKSGAHGTT